MCRADLRLHECNTSSRAGLIEVDGPEIRSIILKRALAVVYYGLNVGNC